jgi:peptidoglycan/xylan/chitin deacetylase (PgdA/CDA1 family)
MSGNQTIKTKPNSRLSICVFALAAAMFLSPGSEATALSCGPEMLGTSRTITVDASKGLAIGLQSYPRTLALNDHEVVLTFDDGPAPATRQVLDALAEQCVRATFFLVGRQAAESPQLVKREIAEGHTVGHHSNTHPERTLRLMSEEAAKTDIDHGIAAVEKAAYGVTGPQPKTPFFRFPGFADTPELVSWLEGRGITIFGSDLWASDWQEMTPQAELELVMGRLEKAKKGIILFHDPRPSTAKMMPDFLRELKKRGFHIVHMVPGAGPTPIEDAGPGWTSTTEPIIVKVLGGKASGELSRESPKPPGVAPPHEPAAPGEKGM